MIFVTTCERQEIITDGETGMSDLFQAALFSFGKQSWPHNVHIMYRNRRLFPMSCVSISVFIGAIFLDLSPCCIVSLFESLCLLSVYHLSIY